MERYAKRIIRNLQNQIIKGTYNPQEGLVYGLSDSPPFGYLLYISTGERYTDMFYTFRT